MEFWNREREIEYLKRYIKSEPNAILFVYGPKSSGKSTLLMEVIDRLMVDEEFSSTHEVYWFDLRERLIANYEDVVDVFFLDEEAAKLTIEKKRGTKFKILSFFEVETEHKKLLEQRRIDPFKYMADVLRESEKTGIIVFDEIQKLKDVYLNSPSNQRPLIKELFNFFVRLTKVLHLSHVIVMTSDTFFIERVYTDSTLKNTSEYYLVDFFDDDTTHEILRSKGFSEEDSRHIVEWIGGVPWMMERVISRGINVVEELLENAKASLRETLGSLYEEDPSLKEEAVDLLKRLLRGEDIDLEGKDRKITRILVEKEILYYDPIKGEIRFQTKLDERAAKELLEVIRWNSGTEKER